MEQININAFHWTRPPHAYKLAQDRIEITTEPGTDLWQRTDRKSVV